MEKVRARIGRSPSYPNFGLGEAIEKAQVIWDRENRNLAPVSTIQRHWGLKPNTGTGLRAVAALKKFGLLEDQGRGEHRQARLSELAQSIILDNRENSPERDTAIREAALMPPIHADLWDEYQGSLPSDETLQYVLKRKRKFSASGAAALIEELRSTIAFAKLEESDSIAPEEGEKPDADVGEELPTTSVPETPNPFEESPVTLGATTVENRILQLPLLGDAWAAIQVPQPMSESEWNQMMVVLEAMKPGIVGSAKANTPEPHEVR